MIRLRNMADWAGLPIEAIAGLPVAAEAELYRLIEVRAGWVVGERKPSR